MFTLKGDQLELAFPELHKDARLIMELERTVGWRTDIRRCYGQMFPLPLSTIPNRLSSIDTSERRNGW